MAQDVALLRREGDYWTLAVGPRLLRLRHLKGFDHLARLLREPGREIPAIELAAPRGYRRADGAPAAPAAERQRVAVTKAIRCAVRRIAAYDPELGALLEVAIQTGSTCSYRPVPGCPRTWRC